jgi:hypothetical protein
MGGVILPLYLTDHILEMNKTVWLSEWLMQASTLKFVR